MKLKQISRLVIAGVGLIGGSVGLALRRAKFSGKIIGLGRRWSSLKNAIDVGAVDNAMLDYQEALNDADLLLISTPVEVIPEIARRAIEYVPENCVITDAGSTKGQLVSRIQKIMPGGMQFVGAHPMAGSHKTSVMAADESLFDNSICIVTPTETTAPEAVELVSDLWETLGARVKTMSPQEHDFLIAAASHLPHAVACALTQVVAGSRNDLDRAIDFTATGFADTTRIASGDVTMWKGIFSQNADMISDMLKRMEEELADIRRALDERDQEKIAEKLTQAKQIRDSIRR